MPEITYRQVGDYLLPNLMMDDRTESIYGKYGMLRKRYLKQHRSGTYASLLLSGKLNKHLVEMDTLTKVYISRLVEEMATKHGIDEELKARDQMAWVGAINTIKAQAEEIAMTKYVYC